MTLLTRTLFTSFMLAGFALSCQAAPSPEDFGASVLTNTPRCKAGQLDPQRVDAVNAATSPCCAKRAQCSQFLATTSTSRKRELSHT